MSDMDTITRWAVLRPVVWTYKGETYTDSRGRTWVHGQPLPDHVMVTDDDGNALTFHTLAQAIAACPTGCEVHRVRGLRFAL